MGKKRGGGIRIKQQGPTKAQKDMMKQMANGGNPMEEFMTPPEDMVTPPPEPDRNFQMFWPIRKLIFVLLAIPCFFFERIRNPERQRRTVFE